MPTHHPTTELARKARELALSGKHQDHLTILARLSRSNGFATVQLWAQDQLVRIQLDELCRKARERLAVSGH